MAQTVTSQLPNSPEERLELFTKVQKTIKEYENYAQYWFKFLDRHEGRYRLFGMLYHTTSLQARISSRISPAIQQHLRIQYIDYNVWRDPWAAGLEILQKILWEARPNGTLEALLEREKVLDSLRHQFRRLQHDTAETADPGLRGYNQPVQQQREEMVALQKENARLNDAGLVTRWYLSDAEADKARGFRLPAVMGPEWEMFQQWVYTLPETRKSMFTPHDPRPLDLLASNLLYKAPEVRWDAHWNAPPILLYVHPFFSTNDIEALAAGQATDVGEQDLPDLPTDNSAASFPGRDPPANEPADRDEEADVLGSRPAATAIMVLPDARPLVASHAVTPDHQVVEDGFID